jgi:hypothetical protein
MSKREKVILFGALLAILYGAYSVFLDSPSKPPSVDTEKKKTELTKVISDVSGNLSKEVLDKADIYIIARAEAEWRSDPFSKTVLPKKSEARKPAKPLKQKVSFTYSGYVEMGDKRLAIINGIEYETGEELELAGYIVEKIEPFKVVIRGKKRQKRIIVPMKEGIL